MTMRMLKRYFSLMMLKRYFSLLMFLFSPSLCGGDKTEGELVAFLLRDPHLAHARPVRNASEAVTVVAGITLQQIVKVNEEKETITTNTWLNFEWTSEHLQWNKTEYGGIIDIRLKPEQVWLPDVEFYNGLSWESTVHIVKDTNMVVTNTGSVTWIPPAKVTTTCKIDLTWFPFDDQECQMKMGSWTYNGFKLDLRLNSKDGGDTSTYILNNDWALVDMPAKRNEVFYECCPEPYLDITFTIKLRRRTIKYIQSIIIPTFITTFIAILSLLMPAHKCSSARFLAIFISLFHLIIATSSIKVPNINNSLLGGILSFFFMLQLMLMVLTIFTVSIADTPIYSLHRFTRGFMEFVVSFGVRLCCINPLESKYEDDQVKCQYLSKMLDGVAFAIFSIIFVVGFTCLLVSAPHLIVN